MAETHLVILQGSTQTIEIPDVKDANGALINPAGCSVRGQIRADKFSTTVLHEWVSPTTATITTGKVTLSVPAATSAAWTFTFGRYDLELTDADGNVSRIAEGNITISREVTR